MKLISISNFSQWIKVYRLYRTSFPYYERKPFAIIRKMNKKGKTDVWIIENNGAFCGFAITMNEKDMILLDYFAICKDMRGKGVGARALTELYKIYKNNRLFLEIESVYAKSKNICERIRRKKFYLNNGMTELKIMVNLLGTDMELLGYNCKLTYDEYRSVYANNYGEWISDKIIRLDYPEIT